jgi:lysophospholipase L1-like esterase
MAGDTRETVSYSTAQKDRAVSRLVLSRVLSVSALGALLCAACYNPGAPTPSTIATDTIPADTDTIAFDTVCTRRDDTIKIMPLGNSITESIYTQATYRYWLYTLLVDSGYPVDFVGSMHGAYMGEPKYSGFDQDHEGHWGWTVEQVLEKIEVWMDSVSPDIILCHLGTNDIYCDQRDTIPLDSSIVQTVYELDSLIGLIRMHNPSIIIFLAQIIPNVLTDRIASFNAALPILAHFRSTPDSPIIVVDQYTGFDLDTDSFDKKHPNEQGEKKMTQRWFTSLAPVLDSLTLSCTVTPHTE